MNLEDGLLGFVPQPNLRALHADPLNPNSGVVFYSAVLEKGTLEKASEGFEQFIESLRYGPFAPGSGIGQEE